MWLVWRTTEPEERRILYSSKMTREVHIEHAASHILNLDQRVIKRSTFPGRTNLLPGLLQYTYRLMAMSATIAWKQ